MGKVVGNVEFYAGPDSVNAPDNLEDVIVKFIDKAEKRLEIAVQELENMTIGRAIVAAKQRKVIVKVVIEQDYLRVKRARVNPFDSGGIGEDNRLIQSALYRSNIDVKCDYNTSIFHQKFIIRDRESVLTGSTNFTPTGTDRNLNHVVIVHDPEVARIYYREFREIQQGHFGKLNEGHDPAPDDVNVGDLPIRVLFAPDHNPEMEIMKQMLKARERIDFAIFTFAKSSGIDDTMVRLLDAGMPIRGAFDGRQGGHHWSAIETLQQHNAELYSVPERNGVGKLHHKLMVLDDEVIIAGSFNYTGPANNVNDENIIILGDLDSAVPAQRAAQKELATYAREEIDRIIGKHGEKFNLRMHKPR